MVNRLFLIFLSFIGSAHSFAQVSLVKDFYPGSAGSPYPAGFTIYNNKLYFYANDGNPGGQLWSIGAGSSQVPTLVSQFSASTQMGAAVADPIEAYNGKLYFAMADSAFGTELWEYDGANFSRLTDINVGYEGSQIKYVTGVGNKIYFGAYDKVEGSELWMYDIYTKNVVRTFWLKGNSVRLPLYFTSYQDELFFSAFDTLPAPQGLSLFRHKPGTNFFQNIDVGTVGASSPQNFCVAYNKLYYIASPDGNASNLYVYDPMTFDSKKITTFTNTTGGLGLPDRQLVALNGALYYADNDRNTPGGGELYRIDTGTYQITLAFELTNTNPSNTTCLDELYVFNNKIFFVGDDLVHGKELWSYDGVNPPVMVADINKGMADSYPMELTEFNGALYFSAIDTGIGRELYKYTEPVSVTSQSMNNFNIYPNPTTGHITIDLGKVYDNASVEIVSMLGQAMFTKTYKTVADMEIDIEAPAGMYLVHIKAGEEEQVSIKILKTE